MVKLSVLLPLLCGTLALAQTSPPPPHAAPAEGPSAPSRPAQSNGDSLESGRPADNVFFEQGADRQLVPVSPEAALRAGARFLQDLEDQRPPTVPDAYLSRVWLDGDVRDDYVEMTAAITVEVTRDAGWFDVPLALNQAHIYASEHSGPGAAAARVGGPPEEGVNWTVTGKGSHQLVFKFRAPVRTSPAGQQLLLNLPVLPPQFRTRCVLRLPEGWELVPARPGSSWAPRRNPAAGREVELDIAGQRLELAWRHQSDASARVSRTVTLLNVRRVNRSLQLTALQEFEVEQGTLSQVEVRLPRDFSGGTVRRLGVAAQETRPLDFAVLDGRPGWVFVDLNEPLSGRFELEWTFRRPFPEAGGQVAVDGLEVAGAADQQGQIQVEEVDGYEVDFPEQEQRALQPINADGRTGLRRYEFFQQPFELALALRPAAPRVDARTRYFLWVETARTDLYCEVELAVLSGVVDALLLDWPAAPSEQWTCRAATVDVLLESGANGTSERLTGAVELPVANGALVAPHPGGQPGADVEGLTPGQLRVRLSRPVTGRFPVPTRLRLLLPFSRPLSPGEDRFPVKLPHVEHAHHTSGSIVLSGAIELEPSLSHNGAALAPLASASDVPADLPAEFEGSRSVRFPVPDEPQPLEVSWVRHERSIAADALLQLEERGDGSFRVVQQIVYHVQFGRLASLLLQLPPPLQEQFPAGTERLAHASADLGLQVRLSDGTSLEVQRQGAELRALLPAARHGTFEVTLEYALSAPEAAEGQADSLDLPVVASLDAPFANTVISVRDADRIRLAESETGWRKSRTLSGGIAWQSPGAPSAIPLVVDDSPLNVPQQYTVDSVFLRTRFSPAGEARTQAEFALNAAPARIVLLVPDEARELEFRWSDAVLTPESESRESEGGHRACVLDLPAERDQSVSGRLRLDYTVPSTSVQDLAARATLNFPRFPSQVRVRETCWELLLPPGVQLARSPRGMVPQFSWQRRAAVWMRRSTPQYLARRAELTSLEPLGDSYAFSAVGPIARVEFRAMSQSLIILIGAGVSLLLGFLFRRVPATRSLFSLLLLGFLLALAGVWYLELMQLLLQPALLGLLLAAVATTLDVAARRRHAAARADSTFVPSTANPRESRSSLTSSLPPAPPRTALYRPAGASDSGGDR